MLRHLPVRYIGYVAVLIAAAAAFLVFVTPAEAKMPAGLSGGCAKLWREWQSKSGYGAFADNHRGCGSSDHFPSLSAARSGALSECAKHGKGCRIISEKATPPPSPYASMSQSFVCRIALDWQKANFEDKSNDAVAEANRRGYSVGDCRVALGLPRNVEAPAQPNTPTPNIHASDSQSSLCQQALNNMHDDFDPSPTFSGAVAEAKRRGYSIGDCRVAIGLPRDQGTPAQPNTPTPDTHASDTQHSLCWLALNNMNDDFDPSPTYSEAVAEAKRRGYSVGDCRVAIGLPRDIAAADTQYSVCQGALNHMKDDFDESPSYSEVVAEAKRRGYSVGDCRVALGLPRDTSDKLDVCGSALNEAKADFDSSPDHSEAVARAKDRGYTVGDCRVALGLPRAVMDGGVLAVAQEVLAAAGRFGKSGVSSGKIVGLVPYVVALNKAIAAGNEAATKEATKALQDKLAADPDYAAFLTAEAATKQKAAVQELAEATGGLELMKAFASDYIARNMLSDNLPKLADMIADMDKALATKDADKIKVGIEAAKAGFAEVAIAEDYNSFVTEKCGKRSLAGCSEDLALNVPVPADPGKQVTPQPQPQPVAPDSGRRVALVIGNSAYQNANQLPNPRNDSAAIAMKLRALGFEVMEGEDLDKPGMDRVVRQFENSLYGVKVALLFYAGHGMQYEGRNYLIPVDAKLADATAVDYETIGIDAILDTMTNASHVSIALLDSCRDNPLARQFARIASRSATVGRGMAAPETQGNGVLIAFATAPGQTASDGEGDHSPFTRALLDNIDAKNVEISLMFKRVRQEVIKLTNNQQQPWENSSLDEFYLNQ